jgi:hypothetical protein
MKIVQREIIDNSDAPIFVDVGNAQLGNQLVEPHNEVFPIGLLNVWPSSFRATQIRVNPKL